MADLHEIDHAPLPKENVVEYAEDILRRAKSGEIQGFAIAIDKGRRVTGNGWSGLGVNCVSIIGEIETMKVDLIRSNVEQRYDCCGDPTD